MTPLAVAMAVVFVAAQRAWHDILHVVDGVYARAGVGEM